MKAAFLILSLTLACHLGMAQPVDVLPVRMGEGAQSLNGDWKLKYIPSSDVGPDEKFFDPSFDVKGWRTTPVPSHWELHGFAEPQYADNVKEGTGLYRRSFHVPQNWKGQRVFVRFDGVLYGFITYINGKPIGEWASSFNAVTFDVTDAILPGGAENILAVRVTTRSKGWNFDNMDCWALSGIYRDVTLFALPAIHLNDYTLRTALKPDGTADLHLDVAASAAAKVAGRLLSPAGQPVKRFEVALSAEGRGSAEFDVSEPKLWTAETPHLYRLELDLQSDGATVQSYHDRIGLREVTTDNGVLKLNGVPIKLRGVDHHDIWPLEGRVATEDNMRRDLELIRQANINFIRTSHYPPHPRFIEMCDEMGIYVDEEVPYIHGRKNLKDPSYQDVLLTRARATVMRDKNRPSIIFWTCGNENPVTELGNNTGRYVKELDPTRPFTFPTIGSQFEGYLKKFPENMELYAAHYPSVKLARRWAETMQRPIVFTEYAHQRGIARAGSAVQDLWEVFYHSPRIAGGAVWMFQDQGLLRRAENMSDVKDQDWMVWLDQHRYYDTQGFYAVDGIVYSDRRPQVDYWQVRKVYSPVQIAERELKIQPGAQTLALHVENRFDFRSLEGVKLKWSLQRSGASIHDGIIPLHAPAKTKEIVPVSVSLPYPISTDVFALQLECEDEQGHSFHERSIRLDSGKPDEARWDELRASLTKGDATLEVSDSAIAVHHRDYQLKLDRPSGRMSLLTSDGKVIVSGFGPNMGRHPTMNDMGKNRERLSSLWRWGLLHEVTDLKTSASRQEDGIEITVSGTYPRPEKPEECIRGEYKLLVKSNGAIGVTYHYTPINASGEVLEAGFALAVPTAQSEFRWLGQGPYAAYPGKDRLDEYGIFHLNREDLYFPGNRRGVEFASLASPSGVGVLMSGNGMTIDLENLGDVTLLSHLAVVPGQKRFGDSGGENVDVSSRSHAGLLKEIAGHFDLLPLGTSWPQLLVNWLGASDTRAEVTKPYLKCYDQ